MKNVASTGLLVLTAVFSAASAFAQSDALTAKVPFAFSVNDKVLPAGRYEIQQVSDQQIPGGILVRNLDNPQYTAVALGSDGPSEVSLFAADKARLTFDDYNGQHFLREVRGMNPANLEFPITKAEKNAARTVAARPTQTIVVTGQ